MFECIDGRAHRASEANPMQLSRFLHAHVLHGTREQVPAKEEAGS
jgi:hypothetical protein